MGIMDFVKEKGRQLVRTDAATADQVKQTLDIRLSGIDKLGVTVDDGVATLSGECDCSQTRDTAIMIASAVEGVERVVAGNLVVPEPAVQPGKPAPDAEERVYEVRSGDTLGGIATKFYGNASAYVRIFDANRDTLDDPDRIYPGQKLLIP